VTHIAAVVSHARTTQMCLHAKIFGWVTATAQIEVLHFTTSLSTLGKYNYN